MRRIIIKSHGGIYIKDGGHGTHDPQEARVFDADSKRTQARFSPERYGYEWVPVELRIL